MIEVKNLVPEVYYNHSRDFQLIGRLYEIIFNYLKTEEDSIYNIPLSESSPDDLLLLMSYTLGFKSKHNYPLNQLRGLCNCFSEIIRNKGNITSIKYALNALLRVENIDEEAEVFANYDVNGLPINSIIIYIPSSLKDINLFKDLLDYIMPVGFSYTIYRHSLLSDVEQTNLTTSSDYTPTSLKTFKTSYIPGHQSEVELSDIKGGRIDNTLVVPYDSEAEGWQPEELEEEENDD